MKKTSKKIIKSLLLSAALALISNNNVNAEDSPTKTLSLEGLDNDKLELEKGKNPVMNNVYKIRRDGDLQLIAAHRSHRSHSSHRSHRSSSYGSSYGGSYRSSSSSYGSSSSSSRTTAPAKTPATYTLGDRTLKNGLYGADIDMLVPYLTRNFYIKESSLNKRNGYYLYDTNVEKAIRHFQKDAGLTEDGTVNSTTLSKLKYWDVEKTTIEIGIREITIGTSGYDIDELIKMLTNAGYAPDPTKLKKNGSHYEFTEDVKTAVKMFQAYNGISPTGNVDSKTINKLKSVNR